MNMLLALRINYVCNKLSMLCIRLQLSYVLQLNYESYKYK
jgi:hypothetical protein